MTIDEILLQRCLDGELSSSEQRELIAELEADESCQGWRRLALEFMEEQAFRCVLVARVQEQEPTMVGSLIGEPAQNDQWTVAPEPHRKPDYGSRRMVPLIAASLLIGLFSGSFGGRLFSRASNQDVAPGSAGLVVGKETPNGSTPETERPETIDAQNLQWFVDNRGRLGVIPVASPSGTNAFPVSNGPIPHEVMTRQLLEKGYEFHPDQRQFRIRNQLGQEDVVRGVRVIPAMQ